MADIVSFCCHEAGAFDSLSGLSAVRESATEWGAGIGLRKKRMPFCNGMDRSFNVTPRETGQTSALGNSLQETC